MRILVQKSHQPNRPHASLEQSIALEFSGNLIVVFAFRVIVYDPTPLVLFVLHAVCHSSNDAHWQFLKRNPIHQFLTQIERTFRVHQFLTQLLFCWTTIKRVSTLIWDRIYDQVVNVQVFFHLRLGLRGSCLRFSCQLSEEGLTEAHRNRKENIFILIICRIFRQGVKLKFFNRIFDIEGRTIIEAAGR